MPVADLYTPKKHVVYCGFLLSLSAFSIDITLPFFPAIAATLGAPLSAMPSIVTIYLLFIGIGNLVFGPMSDKYGRKPVLIGTISAFIAGALISGSADTLPVLLVGRALQGFSVGAVTVLATAMLRDRFTGRELARSMAVATGIFSIGPIVAPLLGVGIAELGGSWRTVFYATGVYAAMLLAVQFVAPESLQYKTPDALQPTALWRNIKMILMHPQSGYFLLVTSATMLPMMVIISTSPTLYSNVFGVSGNKFALLFAIHGTGIIVGQFLNHRLIPILGIVKTGLYAASVMIAAALLVSVAAAGGWINEYWMSFFITLFAIGYLSVIANATSMVLQPQGDKAGLATSLRGSMGMVVSAICGSIIALFVQDSALMWGITLSVLSLIPVMLLLRWLGRSRASQ